MADWNDIVIMSLMIVFVLGIWYGLAVLTVLCVNIGFGVNMNIWAVGFLGFISAVFLVGIRND